MTHQHAAIESNIPFGFVANLTTGSANDGSAAVFDVRLVGASVSAAPVYSGSCTGPLSHANYGDGCYEIVIPATAANGFAAGNSYLVFATLSVDSQTPGKCVGSFTLGPVVANVTQFGGSNGTFASGRPEVNTTHVSGTAQTAGDLKTLIDAVQADLPQRITKNTALSGFPFLMVDSSDHSTPKTGLTVTATRSLDGAAFGACANSVSEIGNGFYKLDLAAADLNGNTVALKFTATGADQRSITLVTQPT